MASDVARRTNKIRIGKDPVDLTVRNSLVTLAKTVLGECVWTGVRVRQMP